MKDHFKSRTTTGRCTPMTIGQLAKIIGVSVETIRFYHRQELLALPRKPESGFRTYTNEHVQKLKFIINAKALGFTLNEIKELGDLSSGCKNFYDLAKEKLGSLEVEIQNLQHAEVKIKTLLSECCCECDTENCSVIEKLYQ